MPSEKKANSTVHISSLKTKINKIETYQYEQHILLLILICSNLFSKLFLTTIHVPQIEFLLTGNCNSHLLFFLVLGWDNPGVKTPIMGERGCGSWLRMTQSQFWRKNCTKMHMAQNKRSSSYHSRYLMVMMWRWILTKIVKLMMGFLLWRCWSKIWEKETGKISRYPGRSSRNRWKIQAKFFMQSWGKNHSTKNWLNLLSKNPVGKYDVIITEEMQLQWT